MSPHRHAEPRPWQIVEQEVTNLLARVEPEQFDRLLTAFDTYEGRWFFSGQGRSGLIAQMAAMRMMHVGYDVHVVGEVTGPSVRKGDHLFLVCGSGQTPVSVGFASIAKAEGAELIVVTHKPQSRLAMMADVLLSVPIETSVQFGGSLFEQCCLILFDSVALRLAERRQVAAAAMWQRHTNMQ